MSGQVLAGHLGAAVLVEASICRVSGVRECRYRRSLYGSVSDTGGVPNGRFATGKRRPLASLDHAALDRHWSNRWLVAASIIGLALAVLGAVGYFVGDGAGTTQIPFGAGMCVFGLALSEIWTRRQHARGRDAFVWLRRLDERVLRRK